MSYTPKQTSEMLNIPASTLRRYAKQFSEHLSESANKSRGREYSESDIATLGRARELLRSHSPEDTNNLLSVMADEPPEPDSSLALIPSISEALTELTDAARSLRAEVDTIKESQAQSDERQALTDEQLAEVLKKLEHLEQPWYRRIFKSAE